MGTIQSVADAINALVGLVTKIWNAFKKAQAQTDQEIDQQEQKNKQDAENTGRPV